MSCGPSQSHIISVRSHHWRTLVRKGSNVIFIRMRQDRLNQYGTFISFSPKFSTHYTPTTIATSPYPYHHTRVCIPTLHFIIPLPAFHYGNSCLVQTISRARSTSRWHWTFDLHGVWKIKHASIAIKV